MITGFMITGQISTCGISDRHFESKAPALQRIERPQGVQVRSNIPQMENDVQK